jgi:hypothetical protein
MNQKTAKFKRQLDVSAHNQPSKALKYWLSKTPQERLAAVTFLVHEKMKPGQRMDKTVFLSRKLK